MKGGPDLIINLSGRPRTPLSLLYGMLCHTSLVCTYTPYLYKFFFFSSSCEIFSRRAGSAPSLHHDITGSRGQKTRGSESDMHDHDPCANLFLPDPRPPFLIGRRHIRNHTHVHVHDTAHAYIASQEREGCTNTLLHHRVFIHTCPYIHEFTSPVLFERRSKGFLFWLLLISWLCTPTLFKSRLFMSLVLTLKSCTK
jgi:hypothetical protein